ncbi:hypothetical protein RIF29_06727 [Crotalaria pallida]|uniref:Uncharacterized protein n=1 Tax=Crotalaria pallida TaxID=3830 RepID=A0AAN9J654_CROPI
MILYSAERAWSHAMEEKQLPKGPKSLGYGRRLNGLPCFHICVSRQILEHHWKLSSIGLAINFHFESSGAGERYIHGPSADSIPADKRLVIFDKIFSAYHEARGYIRADLATTGSAESMKEDLSAVLG